MNFYVLLSCLLVIFALGCVLYKLIKQYSNLSAQWNHQWFPFPIEIVQQIGSATDAHTIVQMSGVCKKWNIVMKDNFVWKPIVYAHYANYMDEEIQREIEKNRHGYYNQFKDFIGEHSQTTFFEEIDSYRKEKCLRIRSTTLLLAVGVPLAIALLIALTLHTPNIPIEDMDLNTSCNSGADCLFIFLFIVFGIILLKLLILILTPIMEHFLEPLFISFGYQASSKIKIDLQDHRTSAVLLGASVIAGILATLSVILIVLNIVLGAKLRSIRRNNERRNKLKNI